MNLCIAGETGGISFLRGFGRARMHASRMHFWRVRMRYRARNENSVVGKTTKATLAHRRPN